MSWFRNLTAFRLTKDVALLFKNTDLKPFAFAPCGSLEIESSGWVPPVEGGDLVYVLNRQLFLAYGIEKKTLPKQVIDRMTRDRCRELEKLQGFAPGRKQMREVREDVLDELLPKAFTTRSTIGVWVDPVNGWLCVNSATPGQVDAVLHLMLRSFEKLPVETLRTKTSPVAAMTDWLLHDEAPDGFTIDQDAEMQSTGEGKATVRYIRHTLEADTMRRDIEAGKQCTRLALTWGDKASFVLTGAGSLKSIEPLDVLKGDEPADRDGDLMLMTGELNTLLHDVVEALGGLYVEDDA